MPINIIERAMVPYNSSDTRLFNKSQYSLFVPLADVNKPGMAGYNPEYFTVQNGIVTFSQSFVETLDGLETNVTNLIVGLKENENAVDVLEGFKNTLVESLSNGSLADDMYVVAHPIGNGLEKLSTVLTELSMVTRNVSSLFGIEVEKNGVVEYADMNVLRRLREIETLISSGGILSNVEFKSNELLLTFVVSDGSKPNIEEDPDTEPDVYRTIEIDLSEFIDPVELADAIANIPVKNGAGEGSVVIGGGLTLGDFSAAMGSGSIAGMKAYYYSGINPSDKIIYLSSEQSRPPSSPAYSPDIYWYDSSFTAPNWKKGDWLGVMNTSHYVFQIQVESVSGNAVKYSGELGFTKIPLYGSSYDTDKDSYTVYNLTRPTEGAFVMTGWATALGLGAKAVGSYSLSVGKNTTAYNYGVAEGHTTTAGYAGHAEGKQTKALGDEGSHAEGRSTEVRGNRGHAEGSFTQTFGWGGHAEGRSLYDDGYESYNKIAYSPTLSAEDVEKKWKSSKDTDKQLIAFGEAAHAEGGGTAALGDFSHTEGLRTLAKAKASHASGVGTETLTEGETAVGRYNERTSGNLFSVGNGTSDTARSTVFAIRENGNMDFGGVVVTPEQLSGYRIASKTGRFSANDLFVFENRFAYGGTYVGNPSASREGYVEFASSDTSMWQFTTLDTTPVLSPDTYLVLNPKWALRPQQYAGIGYFDASMQGDIVILTSETIGPGVREIRGTVYYIEEA